MNRSYIPKPTGWKIARQAWERGSRPSACGIRGHWAGEPKDRHASQSASCMGCGGLTCAGLSRVGSSGRVGVAGLLFQVMAVFVHKHLVSGVSVRIQWEGRQGGSGKRVIMWTRHL